MKMTDMIIQCTECPPATPKEVPFLAIENASDSVLVITALGKDKENKELFSGFVIKPYGTLHGIGSCITVFAELCTVLRSGITITLTQE